MESAGAPAKTGIVVRLRLPRAWTPEEDARLWRLAEENRFGHWHRVARRMAAPGRYARACRDRWRHHLARDVYHRPFTARDDEDLRSLVAHFGGRWKDIARAVYARTSRVMRRRWREIIRERAAAREISGGPPALPCDDGGEDSEITDTAAAVQLQGPVCYADDILASS